MGISTYFEPHIRLGNDWQSKDAVQFTLDFNRAKDSDTYFLNDYTAILNTHNGIERKQEFNLERDHRITAAQAYRLLLGAALQRKSYSGAMVEMLPQRKRGLDEAQSGPDR